MKNKILYFIVSCFLKVFLNFCLRTCRWKIHNQNIFKDAEETNFPILICCWHQSFVLVSRYLKEISLQAWAVSSTHRDSQIMANILQAWKFKLIKGSSTRGWRNVLKSMMTLFKNIDSVVAITNDGPKGPPFIAK